MLKAHSTSVEQTSGIVSLAIPCHWNKRILNQILKQDKASKKVKIKEIYGSLAVGDIGHGRNSKSVVDVSRGEAIKFRNYVKRQGLDFVYLINAPFELDSSAQIDKALKYLKWIITKFNADGLMVSSLDVMKLIKEYYPETRIYVSTIAGVKTVKDLKKYYVVNPKRVVLHHDVNRNFKDLKEIIAETKKRNIELEIMTTESCLRRCPNRKNHYKFLSGGCKDNVFHTVCNKKKLEYPREILKSNVIRPEDLKFYKKLGIEIFKITGRSKKASWLPEVTKAYLTENYQGNLIRLLGIDPIFDYEKWIYINNYALNGFLEKFPNNGIERDEDKYCEKWIIKLYQSGDFKLLDGSKYTINKSKELVLLNPGKKADLIISKESV